MQIREAKLAGEVGLFEVFPESKEKHLRFEGIEKTDDGKFWQVTFSFSTTSDPDDALARSYKTVKLRNDDGELVGAHNGFIFDAA